MANAATAEGGSNGTPPPRSAVPLAADLGSGSFMNHRRDGKRGCAAGRVLFPKPATHAMRPPGMALSPLEAPRARYNPSECDTLSAQTSPSTDMALLQQRGGSPVHFSHCADDKTQCSRATSSDGSSNKRDVPEASPSSIFPLTSMTQAQLSPALPRPTAEGTRVSSECTCRRCDAAKEMRGTGAVGSTGAARRCRSSEIQCPYCSSSAVQPMLRQPTHTSYAVHRIVPRMQHPHFTRNAQHLFPNHHLSRSDSSTHAYRPSDHLLRSSPSLHPSLHPSPIFGAVDVCKSVLYTPRSVEPMGLPRKAEHTRDGDVAPPLRGRKDLLCALPSLTQPSRARTTPLRFLLPAPAADIAVTPPTPALSPSQLEKGIDPLLSAATEQRRPQTWSSSSPAPAILLCSDNGRKESRVTASPNMSVLSPRRQQPTYYHDNRSSSAALSKVATSGGYSRRDIQRGTWVFVLAHQECLARELLEAEETSEALRYLPASCAVWGTCDRHFSASAGRSVARLDSSAAVDIPSPSDVSTASAATSVASSEPPSTAADSDASYAAADGASSAHCACVDKEEETAMRTLTPSTSHPAFAAAVHRMEILEGILRGDFIAEEADAFHHCLLKPFVYEHRLLTVGTLPLERFLRSWIVIARARKLLHARRLTKMEVLEQRARAALHETSQTLQRRFQLLVMALVEQEHYYRCALELLHAQAAAWTGVVLLRLQEQVERFPLEFGHVMSRTRVCGRVAGLTLFSNLVLSDQVNRGAISDEEAQQRVTFPIQFEMHVLNLVYEPQARKELADREASERNILHQVLGALQTHYSLREVEIEESIDRQSWMRRPMHAGVDSVLARTMP